MPEPAIVTRLREFKRDVLAREAGQLRDMTRRWLDVERALDARLAELAQDIADRGGLVSRGKLLEMQRYRELLAQARVEVRKYQSWADGRISEGQAQYAKLGLEHAVEAIHIGYQSAGRFAPYFDRLDVDATNAMIGLAGDGSPLSDLLKESYPDAVDGLTTQLIRSVAAGKGPADTARAMRDGFGMGLHRAMTIARTEQLRAYRTANVDEYRASGLVRGYRRLSARDGRTCLACLAADGQWFEIEASFYDHPNGRCTVVPDLVGLPDTKFQTAAQWIRTLPADGQRNILGDQRYELWKSGQVRFSQFAKHTHDETWGGNLTPRPIGELAA